MLGLELQFEDVPVWVDESCARKLRRVIEDAEAVRSECYRVMTRVSDKVRLAFFESLFGGESRVPESDEDALSLFCLCDEVGYSGFDYARRFRFNLGFTWTVVERKFLAYLKELVEGHCQRFEHLENQIAELRDDVCYMHEQKVDMAANDRVLSRVDRVEKTIEALSEECRCLRCDMESNTSSLEELKASERASPSPFDTGIGSSLTHALIDRCEWDFYASSVSVALKVLADGGSAETANTYGVCLENGRGVSQNYEEAARYYKLSADQGDAPGQCNYGACLEHGRGVSQNYEEAARYYKLSADQGNAQGQFCYGLCLEHGRGVSQNREEAARYYKLSADQGHFLAGLSLSPVFRRMGRRGLFNFMPDDEDEMNDEEEMNDEGERVECNPL